MMEKLVKIILRKVEENRHQIVEFLRDLINIPSVTGEEKKTQEFMAERLREWGIRTDMWEIGIEELKGSPLYQQPKIGYEDRPNLVGIVKGVGGDKSLILNGHVDVCSPGPTESWKLWPLCGGHRRR